MVVESAHTDLDDASSNVDRADSDETSARDIYRQAADEAGSR
jgi:hypothetical protein